MNVAEFKKYLAIYGADFSRWENADPKEAVAVLERSKTAKAAYDEALNLDKALAHFSVPLDEENVFSDALAENVLKEIGVETGNFEPSSQQIHVFPTKKAKSGSFLWGGFGAIAACAVLFMVLFIMPDARDMEDSSKNTQVAQMQPLENEENTDFTLAGFDALTEEEIAAREIIGMLQMAENRASANQDSEKTEIDRFLDRFFSLEESETQEENLWELFLQDSGTVEL